MNIVQEIRDFVENECKKPTNKYGYDLFPFHLVPMVAYAQKLADKLGGDKEVISLAGRLHDIGSIIYGREDHHITGAKIAEEKLKEYTYPSEKIARIKNCILHHRGSKNFDRESIEEKIIAEADVISNFDNIGGLFKVALVYEHLNQSESAVSVRQKLQNKRNQLHFEESKILIKPRYEAAMLLLS